MPRLGCGGQRFRKEKKRGGTTTGVGESRNKGIMGEKGRDNGIKKTISRNLKYLSFKL